MNEDVKANTTIEISEERKENEAMIRELQERNRRLAGEVIRRINEDGHI